MQLMTANFTALARILFMMILHNTIEEQKTWSSVVLVFYPFLFPTDGEKNVVLDGTVHKQQFKRVTSKVLEMFVMKRNF